MKNTILLALFLGTLSTQAQDNNKTVLEKLHFNAGATLSNYTFESDQGTLEYNMGVGFRLGADYDVFTKNAFSIETGLTGIYLQTSLDTPEIDYSSFYVGTHVIGNYALLNDRLLLGAGPFIDVAVTATQTVGGKDFNPLEGQDGNDPALSRLNYGVSFRALGTLPIDFPLQVYASYRLGLANIEGADSESGQEFKASYVSIGVRTNL